MGECESAGGNDLRYLLNCTKFTPVRFRVGPRAGRPAGESEGAVFDFVRGHPGATVNDIMAGVQALAGRTYGEVRALVLGLLRMGVLRPAGTAPLEEVDPRYERVSACDICGSPSYHHKVVLWKYNTPVVKCSGCGLLYANPRWKAEYLFGRYTEEYWEHYSSQLRSTSLDPDANYAGWFPYLDPLESVRQTGKLLDVGCATGKFLAAAKIRGWDVYGVEPSRIAAEHAERLTGGHIHVGTLDTAPFPPGQFDAITLWHVLEHVQSPSLYIECSARLVRPGGFLSVRVPSIRSLSYILLGRNWWVIGPNEHIYYFSPRTIARLLGRYGFKIHAMHTPALEQDSWRRWLRYPLFGKAAPLLHRLSMPLVNRFLLGDEVYVLARLMP